MILSIVVPMYNVERYIGKCLQSCLNQDISPTDYEIIVVNDGSPDNSILIAEDFANKNSNIYIINQENQGLSIARNKGLSLAKGEYVWFVDSDDWIEMNCLSGITKCLKNTFPDLLQLQYRLVYDDDSLNKDFYCKIDGVKSGIQQMLVGGVPHPAPFTIYRRDFLLSNSLNFYPKIYHEDSEFKPRVLYFAKRCVSYDKVVYNYYQRFTGNITSMSDSKRAFDYFKVALLIETFYNQIAKGDCDLYFHNQISMMINNALSLVGNKGKDFSLELYNHRQMFVHLRKSSIMKYKIEGALFTLFPYKTVTIYRLLKFFHK